MARDRASLVLALILVLVPGGLLLSSHLGAPFDKNHIGFTAAWYSLSARNFLSYGPARLDGCLSIESGPRAARPRLYRDHPPGVGLVLAGVFALFGEGELQARATALALSLLAAVFFLLYARRLFGGELRPAVFGVLLSLATPVWAFYGSLVDPHGPGLLLSLAGSSWAASRWEGEGRRRDLSWACLFVALGCLYDWAAVLIAGPLGLWALLSPRKGAWKGAFALWGTWAFCFGLLFLQVSLAAGGGGGGLLLPLIKRSAFFGGDLHLHGRTYSFWEVLLQVAKWNWKGIPLPLTLSGLAGALLALGDARRREIPWAGALLVLPYFMGTVISLVFLEAAFEHDYLQIYFAPGAGLGTAYLVYRILRRRPSLAFLLQAGSVLLLVTCLLWGGWKSRARWEAQEAGLGLYREAGRTLAEKVEPGEYLLAETSFLPPLAYYSRRRIFWNVAGPSSLPDPRDTQGMIPGGILVRPGARRGFLLEWARRRFKALKGPFPLAGGDLELYTLEDGRER